MDEQESVAPDADDEDIDRSPPIGVFLSGEAFFKAACHLQRASEAGELRLRFSMPIYYLYCHALELTMKAFLRTRKYPPLLLSRKFGHKLQALWDECVKQGLHSDPITDAFIADAIRRLHPFATSYEFRYLRVGPTTVPVPDAVECAIISLMAAVRPHCEATLSGPVPDRG